MTIEKRVEDVCKQIYDPEIHQDLEIYQDPEIQHGPEVHEDPQVHKGPCPSFKKQHLTYNAVFNTWSACPKGDVKWIFTNYGFCFFRPFWPLNPF